MEKKNIRLEAENFCHPYLHKKGKTPQFFLKLTIHLWLGLFDSKFYAVGQETSDYRLI